MRKLSTTNVTNSVGLPVKSGTLQHLQLAYQEIITALAKSIIQRENDTTNCYIIFGLKNSGSTGSMNVSAGAIYFNGEVYLVDAFTLTVANTAVGNIVVTQYTTNADPVTFTDGISHNVHDIRKIVFTDAASGSGLVDFANLINVPFALVNDQQATLPATYTVKFDRDRSVFFAAASVNATIDFDFTNAVPGAVVRLKWTFGASKTLTINTPAGSTIVADSGNLVAVASATNLLYLLYVGKNAAGNDEVSYTLKQV